MSPSDLTSATTPPSPAVPDLDVVAVGNAIVDVISHATDDFLREHGLVKGSMALTDPEAAEKLYAAMGPGVESSGGSAANTAVGVASFGGDAGFVGRVTDDQLGEVFAHDIRAAGVDFETSPQVGHPPTARCLILVTPDAQRTMNTCLGSAALVDPDDVDPVFVARGAVAYGEGYLWDAPAAKAAMVKAFDAARAAGRRTAFTLSDGFCVDRNRAEFLDLIDQRIDIVFANEAEICSLLEVPVFEAALDRVLDRPGVWVLTRSERGSVVVSGGEAQHVPAAPVDEVVDTTGAGDLYAAGFLFGLTHGVGVVDCARLGSIAAAEVISHVGARPEQPLAGLVPPDIAALLAT